MNQRHSVEEIEQFLERTLARWEHAKHAPGDRTVIQLQKIELFQLAYRTVLGFIRGEPEVPLPQEFDPEQWTRAVSRKN